MKAQKVLSALRVLGKTEKIDPTNMIRLYKSIVVPQLEYAASVWQSGKCEILDRVQRRGLAMCLGVPATASLEAFTGRARSFTLGPEERRAGSQGVWENLRKARTQPIKKALKE